MYSFERNSRVYLKEADDEACNNPTTSRSKSKSPLQDVTGSKSNLSSSRTQTQKMASEVGELTAPGESKTKAQMAKAFQESQEVLKTADDKLGLKTVKTRRVLKKTTTITREEDDNLDAEKIRKIDEWKQISSKLLKWIKDSTVRLNERNFPSSIPELKALKAENDRFKSVEVPPRQQEKEYLASIAREIYKFAEDVKVGIDNELHPDNVDYHWKKMLDAHAARDKALCDEIAKQERLKAMLDKLLRDIAACNEKLNKVEHEIEDEEKRISRIDTPKDLKQFSPEKVLKLSEDLAEIGIRIDSIKRLADDFCREAGPNHPDSVMIRKKVADLIERYRKIQLRLGKLLEKYEELKAKLDALSQALDKFKKAAKEAADWLDRARGILMSEENVLGDLDTVNALIVQHKAFQDELTAKQPEINDIARQEAELVRNAPSIAATVREIAASVASKSQDLQRLVREKSDKLKDALRLAETHHTSTHKLLESLAEVELKLRDSSDAGLVDDEAACKKELADIESLLRLLSTSFASSKDQLLKLTQNILAKCHPDADPVVEYWKNIVSSRWQEIDSWAKQRAQRLAEHLRLLKEILSVTEELISFLSRHEARLLAAESEVLPEAVSRLDSLINEHQNFIDELRQREPSVDKVVRVFSSSNSSTTSRTILQTSTTVASPESGIGALLSSRSSTPSRTSFAAYRDEYPAVKQPRAKLMLDKWRSVWQLVLDIVQRAKDKLDGLEEAKKTATVSMTLTEDKQRQTDEEIIAAELERELKHDGIKAYHVGDGKYRFGDSQQLRPVRVSHGKVVVRSNNNWIPIREFLSNNNSRDSSRGRSQYNSIAVL